MKDWFHACACWGAGSPYPPPQPPVVSRNAELRELTFDNPTCTLLVQRGRTRVYICYWHECPQGALCLGIKGKALTKEPPFSWRRPDEAVKRSMRTGGRGGGGGWIWGALPSECACHRWLQAGPGSLCWEGWPWKLPHHQMEEGRPCPCIPFTSILFVYLLLSLHTLTLTSQP